MSWFQGLSGGKTWSASRILSASGVSNITGFVIFGIAGRGRAAANANTAAVAAPRTRRVRALRDGSVIESPSGAATISRNRKRPSFCAQGTRMTPESLAAPVCRQIGEPGAKSEVS